MLRRRAAVFTSVNEGRTRKSHFTAPYRSIVKLRYRRIHLERRVTVDSAGLGPCRARIELLVCVTDRGDHFVLPGRAFSE